jgi:hypothetical protein
MKIKRSLPMLRNARQQIYPAFMYCVTKKSGRTNPRWNSTFTWCLQQKLSIISSCSTGLLRMRNAKRFPLGQIIVLRIQQPMRRASHLRHSTTSSLLSLQCRKVTSITSSQTTLQIQLDSGADWLDTPVASSQGTTNFKRPRHSPLTAQCNRTIKISSLSIKRSLKMARIQTSLGNECLILDT